MTENKSRLQSIQSLIYDTKISAGRSEDDVSLLAVSKTWPIEKLRDLANQGQRLFGENYIQEAIDKIKAMTDLKLEWHFIGPIQSNKTRDIAHYFDWAQSVDRLKIAKRLNEQRPAQLAPLNICIQINIDNEDSKSGVSCDEVMPLAEQISQLDRLCLRGLMVIPAKHDSESAQRDSFKRAFQLYQQLKVKYPHIDTLSMGMSGDMQIAIEEGSTLVRVGTALFGERQPKTAN